MGYPARAGQSVKGTPLSIAGKVYRHGVGSFSNSRLDIDLHGNAERFTATVGVDDAVTELPKPLPGSMVPRGLQRHPGAAVFEAWVDARPVFHSGIMRRGEAGKAVSVDLRGARRLTLITTDGGGWPYNNPADWADAEIEMKSGMPAAVDAPRATEPPIARGTAEEPAIHGAALTGATPGHPFLYKIPATGAGPLRYAAARLPAGLKLDAATGILTGVLKEPGETAVRLTVSGPRGKTVRTLRIVAGRGKLALTPPLGWNSWNVWARAVDEAKIREAADWMVKSGLRDHGYQFINIDDAWMGERDARGEIQANNRFPDIGALADYVHARGLKLGIYSSPGPKTCQQMEGSYQHEAQDAAVYARWGIDFLKYDLCSYGQMIRGDERAAMISVYRLMGDALRRGPRDIVYSLCQYGRAGVGEWGPEVGGQLWRTTGDIRDSWDSIARIGFSQNGLEKWAGPSRWNDPDMLVIGWLGWGLELHASRLTPDEQLTHVTLWSMLASPLLLGCDLSRLDGFTLALLTNDEVLAVNQDPLGNQAARREQDGLAEVWSKRMSDGSIAVGLFNRGIEPAHVTARWEALGISGKQRVRDLWQRKDAGEFVDRYRVMVPAHGAVLVSLTPARPR
ncbi:MAG: NPCBM/NEW2 domain-containing protein [Bryobacteraceae bacterium]